MGLRLKTLWSVGYEAYLTYSELYFKKLLETGVFIYKKDIFPLVLDTLLMANNAIISLIGYVSITFYLKGMMHMNLLGKILTTVIGTVGIRSSNSCEYLSNKKFNDRNSSKNGTSRNI